MEKLFQFSNSPAEQENLNELRVLLVGNNPIEMSAVHAHLQTLKDKIAFIYISFSDKEVLKLIKQNKPNYVLIDDNYGTSSMRKLLAQLKKIKGHAYALTLLKTKNGDESVFGFQDYLMKESLNPERLYFSIKNALKNKQRLLIS
jgi:DNA-binding NarL/FixJ family response regulator